MTQKDKNGLPVRIEKAAPGDEAAVAALERQCFSRPWSEAAAREELLRTDCVFLKAVAGGRLCGYISCRVALDEAYVGNLAVRPDLRGQGIGAALVRALKAAAKNAGCSFLSLEVRVSNQPARRLYEKEGFRLMGERRRFYSAPTEDAAIYTVYFEESGS